MSFNPRSAALRISSNEITELWTNGYEAEIFLSGFFALRGVPMSSILPPNPNATSVPPGRVATPYQQFLDQLQEPYVWIPLVVIGLLVAWWIVKLVLSIAVPAQVSGRAFLKQNLKRRGVDIGRIPEGAIDEIVQYCIQGAQSIAAAHKLAFRGNARDKNWRANLVRQLQAVAPMIQNILDGGKPWPGDDEIRDILAKYIVGIS